MGTFTHITIETAHAANYFLKILNRNALSRDIVHEVTPGLMVRRRPRQRSHPVTLSTWTLLVCTLLLVGSIILAGCLVWRKGVSGIGWGIVAVAGGLLSFGLLSAAVGLDERAWSISSPGCLLALAVGVLGLVGSGIACLGFRSSKT